MSKAFALAGARVGYLAAAPEVCDALRVVRLPYHLSAVTQAVARAALASRRRAAGQRSTTLRAERDATRRTGCAAQGLTVADSDANFVLFGAFDDRHAVWQGLLDRGVLIRETGPDGWLRVSVGTAAEMAAFRAALTAVTRPVSRLARRRGRETKETQLLVELDLDGPGRADVTTGVRSSTTCWRRSASTAGRPDRPHRRRHRDRRPPHRRGHRDRARPGAARGARRQVRASAASATRWSRWTRRSSSAPSTCPDGPTASTRRARRPWSP